MTKKLLLLAITAIIVLALAGCKTSKKATEGKQSPLVQTEWQLEALYQKPIDPATCMSQPYIVFTGEGQYNGSLGCNSFFGKYYQKKKKLQMEFAGATKKLCPQMETERLFLKGLKENITSFSIKDNILIIYADKEEIFRFKAREESTDK
ncbi:MAG: META domain-containing protein [Bacteroidales bacterium]|nr:META domain-containing protein [Bacteroidales bacterium]